MPSVWTRVTSPSPPLISPSLMSWLMAPSSAWSMAPVAPLGDLTPLNRLTTKAGVAVVTTSTALTLIFRSLIFILLSSLVQIFGYGF